jgi:enediyne biosynthesis protein E4
MAKEKLIRYLLLLNVAFWLWACDKKSETLFTKLSSDVSGIKFVNTIHETPEINILSYEYTYNGGGVAAADFNNDGLIDLYFTGNAVPNKLYVNQGDLKFKDLTDLSGTAGRDHWKTGVSAADVNGDGWMDLYVCYSGPDTTHDLSNQLFINNGGAEGAEPTFTERSVEYGLAATGTFSTQSTFFDYDRDGDLDMFLINHGNHFYSPFINTNALRNMRHPQFGNRLYRNEMIVSDSSEAKSGNYFTEVSSEAGVHGGGINFGLGVSISDLNNDGWPDIYVTNDYEEQDFIYVNNGDGTFKDCTKKSFGHLSRNGMGTDIADFNNDGMPDLIEVDMWPDDNFRQKLLKGPDDYQRYNLMLDSGFHHQQMRNTLQINAGVDHNGVPLFCEAGQLAGVSATDWSWAPLFLDVDNDGLKDLFVTNGYLRDFTSMDFLKYTVEEERKKSMLEGKELDLYKLVEKMPSTRTGDYLFKNNGDLTFSDFSLEGGVGEPNLSFGASHADLDNDGDQELIINNTNEEATVWINNASETTNNRFLQVSLKGPSANSDGIGAKVTVTTKGEIETQVQEQFLSRGYQSSVSPVLHFGLGKLAEKATITVVWADGKVTSVPDVKVNQRLQLDYAEANTAEQKQQETKLLFTDITNGTGVKFIHKENVHHDFDHEPLLPYMLSRLGPALAKGDVNGDGFDDFYIGGASGQSGDLFMADSYGRFRALESGPWKEHKTMEDTGATLFDTDGDGDLDLFVVSGGNEVPVGSPLLDDRLYINDGKGKFTNAPTAAIVADHASGSCVAAGDYDNDGDQDLFVGGRLLPGNFPRTTPGAVLRNESDRKSGKVKFVVATKDVNPDLREPGMVTDARWADLDKNGWLDLVVIGDWMPVRIFMNHAGKLRENKFDGWEETNGLWKSMSPVDFDEDGDLDFVLGNAGLNLPWKVSTKEPLTLYYGDFNTDGKTDPVLCHYNGGKIHPVASRDELLLQLSGLRKKFTTYSSYAKATIEDILEPHELKLAERLTVSTLSSSFLENIGNGNFRLSPLANEAQLSAVTGIVCDDINSDGHVDILLSGNFFPYRTQFGPSDAGMGLLLEGNGKGDFTPRHFQETGFLANGDVRGMLMLRKADVRVIAIARNNAEMSFHEVQRVANDIDGAVANEQGEPRNKQ